MNKKVMILYLCHNRLPYTQQTLIPMLQVKYPFRMIIVNNASTDGTIKFLENINDDRVKVITTKENLPLGAALNVGLAERQDDEYVLRNHQDLLPTKPNWFFELLEASDYLENPGLLGHTYWDLRWDKPEKIFPQNIIKRFPEQDAMMSVGLGTCLTLTTPDLWDRIGKFYDEDEVQRYAGLELCERVRLAGLCNYYVKFSEGWGGIHIHRLDEFKKDQFKSSVRDSKEQQLLWDKYVELLRKYHSKEKPINLKTNLFEKPLIIKPS